MQGRVECVNDMEVTAFWQPKKLNELSVAEPLNEDLPQCPPTGLEVEDPKGKYGFQERIVQLAFTRNDTNMIRHRNR
eukprot:13960798-Ditylum_brightwellii.AAC.1